MKKITFIFVLSGLLFGPVSAGSLIGLRQAVDSALANNTTLANQRHTGELARLSTYQTEAVWQPTMSGSASVDHTQQFQPQNGYESSWGLSLSMTEKLSASNRAKIRASRSTNKASSLEVQTTASDVTYQTMLAWVLAIRDSLLVAVQEDNVTTQQQSLVETEAFFQGGTASQSDVAEQKANLAQADLELMDARNTLGDSKDELAQWMGGNYTGIDLALTGLDEATLSRIESIHPTPSTTEKQSRSLQAQQQRIASARASLDAARLDYWPTLSLGATLGHSQDITHSSSLESDADGSSDYLRLSASLNLTILDQRERSVQVASSKVELAQAELELRSLQKDENVALSKAVRQMSTAQTRLDASRKSLELAQIALQAVTDRHAAGAATTLELRTAQSQLTEAASDLIQSRFDMIEAYLAWRYAQDDLATALNELTP